MTTPQIVTRAGWGARAPRGSVASTTWGRRTGVAIHHSAGPTTQTVRSIQDHQMDRNGWQDIGYNWLVTQDGRIWEGRAGGWLAVGAHAAGQNAAWIGICWIGTSGSTAPSAAALAALRWLVDEARRLAGRRLEVRGHGQVPGQATECPGSRLRAWISDGMPVATPPAIEEDDMPTAREIAQETVKALLAAEVPLPPWQRAMWPGDPEKGWPLRSWWRMAGGHSRAGRHELLAEVAALRAEVEQLPSALAEVTGVHLTDEQVAAIAERVAQAGSTAADRVLARLAAAGEALAGDEPDDETR